MVEPGYVFFKLFAEKIAYCGHERLKNSEIKSDGEQMSRLYFSDRKPLAYRDGKRVHRESDGYYENVNNAQNQILRSKTLSMQYII